MEVPEEGDPDTALNVRKNTPDGKQPRKKIFEVTEDDYFNELKVKTPK